MSLFTHIVKPGECLLEQRPGRATRALPAGRHWRRLGASYVRVDLRERFQALAPQDVLTSDGVSVKVTAVVRWAVTDPVAYAEHSTAPFDGVYLAVQLGLRDSLVDVPVTEAVAAARGELGATLTRTAAQSASAVGVEVREVVVKDVILPSDLRAAFAELVTGVQRAKVQLEQARAETAALRSLANAAKLLDDHPALAKLRLVQALPYGSKLKLSVDGE